MSKRRGTAAIRLTPQGNRYKVALIYRGRDGKQTIGRPILAGMSDEAVADAVQFMYSEAVQNLDMPTEV